MRPRSGRPVASRASGGRMPMRPGTRGRSPCQPQEMTTQPRFIRKPSPTSIGGFGSDPGPKAGRVARLKLGTATVLPRLTTSRRTRPLHCARSTGRRMDTSESQVTRPAASRGASATSVMRTFAAWSGSMAKCRRPFSSS